MPNHEQHEHHEKEPSPAIISEDDLIKSMVGRDYKNQLTDYDCPPDESHITRGYN